MAHGLDDAENGRDDTDCREGIADGGDRVIGLQLVVQDGVDFFVHQRLDLVRPRIADDDQAHIVTDEGGQLLVLQNARRGLEDRGFFRIVDMRFDLVSRLGAQVAHQRVKAAEHVEIVAFLRNLVAESVAERLARILHHLHRIRHDEGADAGAADDQQFVRLEQSFDRAVFCHEAADHTADNDHETNNNNHRVPSPIVV